MRGFMSKLAALLAINSMVLTNDGGNDLFNFVHVPEKDNPPPQHIQNELIAKANEKRKRKAKKRLELKNKQAL